MDRQTYVNEHGTAAVELAVVVLPLLMILLGIVEFGRLYSQQLTMQYAAREAARTIALEYDDPGVDVDVLTADVEAAVIDAVPMIGGVDEFTLYDVQLCSTSVLGPQNAVVTIEDRLDLAIPLPDAVLTDIPVRAQATMPCEG